MRYIVVANIGGLNFPWLSAQEDVEEINEEAARSKAAAGIAALFTNRDFEEIRHNYFHSSTVYSEGTLEFELWKNEGARNVRTYYRLKRKKDKDAVSR